jgi:S1-C subfamily serine protease
MGYPGSKSYNLIKGSVLRVQEFPKDDRQNMVLLKASPIKKVKLLITDMSMSGELAGAPFVNKSGQMVGINVIDLAGYEGQNISLDIDSVRTALQR